MIDPIDMLLEYKRNKKISYRELENRSGVDASTFYKIVQDRRKGIKINHRQSLKILFFFKNLSIADELVFDTHTKAVKYYRNMLGFSFRYLGEIAGHAEKSTVQGLEKGDVIESKRTIRVLENILQRQIYKRRYRKINSITDVMFNLIEKNLYSKRHAAKLSGVCSATVQNMFAKPNQITKKILIKISNGLGVPVEIFSDFYAAKRYFK